MGPAVLALLALAAASRCIHVLASGSSHHSHYGATLVSEAVAPRSAVVLDAYLPGLKPATSEAGRIGNGQQQVPLGGEARVAGGGGGGGPLLQRPVSSAGQRRRRRLQQLYLGPRVLAINSISWYAATPAGSASSSLAADSKFRLAADGTLNWGGGFATGQAMAVNPSQGRWASQLLGGPGGQSRPASATAAYVVVPQFLQCCSLFPSRGYYLSEAATGPAGASAAGGYYWVGEVGYNPLSNSLGVATSQAQAGTFDGPHTGPLASRAVVSRGDQSLGFAGVEAIGQTNAVVNFADPRVEQYGQVLAYPYNLLSPWDPLTCTQVLVSGTASTGLNLNQLLTKQQQQGAAAAANRSSSNGRSPPPAASDAGVRGLVLPSTKILEQADGGIRTANNTGSGGGSNRSTGVSGDNGSRTQAPVGLVPFCAQWFNLQTLDALRSFQSAVGPAYNNDYLDNGDYGGGVGDYSSSSSDGENGHGGGAAGGGHSNSDSGAGSPRGAGMTDSAAAAAGNGGGGATGEGNGSGRGYRGTAAAAPSPAAAGPRPTNDTDGPRVLFLGEADPTLDDSAAAGPSGSLQRAQSGGTGQQAAAVATTPLLDRRRTGAAASPATQLLPPALKQLLLGAPGAQSLRVAIAGDGPTLAGAFRGAAVNATARQRGVLNASLSHINEAWQLRVQAAALSAEAVVRAMVAIADAASPLTAAMLQLGNASYSRAAALSNQGVDAAIAALSAGLPPGVAAGLQAKADAMAAQLVAAAATGGAGGPGPAAAPLGPNTRPPVASAGQ